MRTPAIALIALLAMSAGSAAGAQGDGSAETTVRRSVTKRPPLNGGIITGQLLSAGAGGLVGSAAVAVPFILAGFDGTPAASDGVMIGAVVVGYFVGSGAGVHMFSRTVGLKSSWRATATGTLLGILGGPAVLVTVPIGSTIGFNARREATFPTVAPFGRVPLPTSQR